MSKTEFYQDINNYVYIANKIYCLNYNDPSKLDLTTPIDKQTWTKQGFTNRQLDMIEEYRGFCSEPGHGDDYRQTIGDRWNVYWKPNWKPVEGKWPTIEKLIKHLYGANGIEPDQIEELYDYHTIMMKWPKHKLFGRVLYSHQQGTSKSALAVLESMMFEQNYVKGTAAEFDESYNSHWADALIVHIDEPAFKSAKVAARKLRDLITTEKINKRRMYAGAESSPFHGKILLTSNDTDFMTFEASDRRYWIREITPIAKEDLDPHFNSKMKTEVQHYLHFLLNREMKYPEAVDGTFWLPQSVLLTRGNSKLVGDNVSDEHRVLQEWFESYFLDDKKRDHVYFTINDLIDRVDWDGAKPSSKRVSQVLRDGLKLKQPSLVTRMKNGDNYITKTSDSALKPGRFWRADRDKFNLEIDIFGNL